MDEVAEQIRELVSEACEDARAAAGGDASPRVRSSLAYLRAELLALATLTPDAEAVDAACGCVEEIDAALGRPGRRAAA